MTPAIIDAIKRRLTELERKALSAIADLTSLDGQVSDLQTDVADHETRIVALEPTAWEDLTLSDANWTALSDPQWRQEGDRIWLRGRLQRTTSSFTAGSTLFSHGGSNSPAPSGTTVLLGFAEIAAAAPDAQALAWASTTSVFRTSTATHAVAVGDSLSLDGISWPAA